MLAAKNSRKRIEARSPAPATSAGKAGEPIVARLFVAASPLRKSFMVDAAISGFVSSASLRQCGLEAQDKGHYHTYAPRRCCGCGGADPAGVAIEAHRVAASSGSCRRADNPHGSDPPASNFPVDRFENRPPPGLYRYRGSHLAHDGAPCTPPVADGPGGSAIEKNTCPRVLRAGVSFGKSGGLGLRSPSPPCRRPA